MGKALKSCVVFLMIEALLAPSILPAQSGRFIAQLFSPGSSTLALNPGFTFIQDGFWGSSACSTSSTTCTGSSCSSNGSCAIATTAGTIRILTFATGNTNINFASVLQSGETWTVCSTCHIYNSGHDDMGLAYSFGLSGGELPSTITATFTGDPISKIQVNQIEILPPSGYTAVFDNAATNSSASCTTCTGAAPAVTGTDVIMQLMDNDAPQIMGVWNAMSSPYIVDAAQNGLCLNCTTTTAPTYTLPGASYQSVIGIAFKITAGTFTPPTPVFTLANYANFGGIYFNSSGIIYDGPLITCSPGCGSQTIPSTGSGNLLAVAVQTAGAISNLSSISGGGTWVCSTSIRAHDGSGNYISLCYVLSSSSGVTSFTPTMTSNASVGVSYFEISSTCPSGIKLDTSNATQNTGSKAYYFDGQALILSGGTSANDAIIQVAVASGGVSGMSLYTQPFITLMTGSGGSYAGSAAVLLNTANGSASVYSYPQETGTAGVFAVAFRCGP